MDGSPLDLAKLCNLASLAECGDHLWASVPSVGLSSMLWWPLRWRWKGWRAAPVDILQNPPVARSHA